jgi:molybdopterin/thiamine biosynthesis adenylyltransferase
VHHRQDLLPGFKTEALQQLKILLIGTGGLGSQIGHSLARKGCGNHLILVDSDRVALSNLARQGFYRRDIHRHKAVRLARNLARESFTGARFTGHATDFNPITASRLSAGVDLAIVGIDDSPMRIFASRFFGGRIPVIFTAVDIEANYTWVFVQTKRSPCLGCLFPNQITAEPAPCREDPSSIDILKVSAALVSRAVESVVMPTRRLKWTYYDFNLRTARLNVSDCPTPRPGCAVCGGKEAS